MTCTARCILGLAVMLASCAPAGTPAVPGPGSFVVTRSQRPHEPADSTSTVEATLLDPQGRPTGWPQIRLVPSYGPAATLLSPIGVTRIPNVPPGVYDLDTRSVGFHRSRMQLRVGPAELIRLTIVLEPDTGPQGELIVGSN